MSILIFNPVQIIITHPRVSVQLTLYILNDTAQPKSCYYLDPKIHTDSERVDKSLLMWKKKVLAEL